METVRFHWFLALRTASGFPNRKLLERLARVLLGPNICDPKVRRCIPRAGMNNEFHRALEKVQNEIIDLISSDLQGKEI